MKGHGIAARMTSREIPPNTRVVRAARAASMALRARTAPIWATTSATIIIVVCSTAKKRIGRTFMATPMSAHAARARGLMNSRSTPSSS